MYALYLIVLLSIHTVVSWYPEKYKTEFEEMENYQYENWRKNRYTVFGITNDGKACMDNCKGTCRIDWDDYERKACTVVSNRTAPVYFTARQKGTMAVCLGRCGKYGYDYEWCLVTGGTGWDYCSSEIYRPTHKTYSVVGGLTDGTFCLTECKLRNGQYSCRDKWDQIRKCDPNSTQIPARTIYGNICDTNCIKTYTEPGREAQYVFECSILTDRTENCAPPAYRFGENTREVFYRLNFVYKYPEAEFYWTPYTGASREED